MLKERWVQVSDSKPTFSLQGLSWLIDASLRASLLAFGANVVEGGGVVGVAVGCGEINGYQEADLQPAPDVFEEARPRSNGRLVLRGDRMSSRYLLFYGRK